uniref:Conserved domain protein n=1 Tax=Strongyloides venezuelensis TaxID=75913 RepID=A0A0K0EUI9_STRVS
MELLKTIYQKIYDNIYKITSCAGAAVFVAIVIYYFKRKNFPRRLPQKDLDKLSQAKENIKHTNTTISV